MMNVLSAVVYAVMAIITSMVIYRIMYRVYVNDNLAWNDTERAFSAISSLFLGLFWPFMWILGALYWIFLKSTNYLKKLEK